MRQSVKDQFYQGHKCLKDKSTKDLGFSLLLDGHIFISERLTSKNKELFKDCLKVMKVTVLDTFGHNLHASTSRKIKIFLHMSFHQKRIWMCYYNKYIKYVV